MPCFLISASRLAFSSAFGTPAASCRAMIASTHLIVGLCSTGFFAFGAALRTTGLRAAGLRPADLRVLRAAAGMVTSSVIVCWRSECSDPPPGGEESQRSPLLVLGIDSLAPGDLAVLVARLDRALPALPADPPGPVDRRVL